MKLDLRRPTLVLAGAWNPAIFRPGWIAQHVFGMPSGTDVTVTAVQAADDQAKLVIYINDVGLSASANRLAMFAVDVGQSAFDAVENAIAKIVELLPHTPILAYGINFHFVEENPSPELLKKIRSSDALETRFDIAKETIVSVISLDPTVQLSIHRQNDGSTVIFDFNFHRSVVDAESFIKNIHGEIRERMEQGLSIMRDIYGLSSFEVQRQDFDSNQAE
jgi:hypothetical protein